MTPLHANHVTVLTPLEVKNCSCFNSFIKGTNLINSLFNLFWLFFLHWNYIWYFIKAIQIRLCSRTPVVPKYIDNWINRFLAHSSHQRQLELCSEKLNMIFFLLKMGNTKMRAIETMGGCAWPLRPLEHPPEVNGAHLWLLLENPVGLSLQAQNWFVDKEHWPI